MKVKARAVMWCGYDEDKIGPDMFGANETTDMQLTGTIILDILSMAGS